MGFIREGDVIKEVVSTFCVPLRDQQISDACDDLGSVIVESIVHCDDGDALLTSECKRHRIRRSTRR